jgi:predicted CXXCH cytochrome family protein
MNVWSRLAMLWALVLAISSVLAGQEPAAGEFRPLPPPEQPIAFSHQRHVGAGLSCAACHAGAETTERAGLPATSVCMGCHTAIKADSEEIQKVAAYHQKQEDIPWRRVYRVPSYVTFSHARHLAAGQNLTCDTCHGAVRDLVRMQKLRDTSMAACMACHTEKAAPTRCDTCHEPR